MKTKLFAAFLAVCMVFSLLPVSALAADGKITISLVATVGDEAGKADVQLKLVPEEGAEVPSDVKFYCLAGNVTALKACPASLPDGYDALTVKVEDGVAVDKATVNASAGNVVNIIAVTEETVEDETTTTVVGFGSTTVGYVITFDMTSESAGTITLSTVVNGYEVNIMEEGTNIAGELKKDGYIFAGWAEKDADGKLGTPITATTRFTENTTLYPVWTEAAKYAVTITAPEEAQGTLTVKAGEKAINSGDEVYENTVLTIVAGAKTGYRCDAIKVDGKAIERGEDGKYTVTVTKAITISADFVKTYHVTYEEKPANGKVLATPSDLAVNEWCEIETTPDEGYEVTSVSYKVGAGEDAEEVTVNKTDDYYRFQMPAANVSVGVIFGKIQYAINGSASNGKVSFAVGGKAATTAGVNDEVTVVATPDPGYEVDTITYRSGDAEAKEVKDSKFTMPASSVTVTATFKKATYNVTVTATGGTGCTAEADKETAQMGDKVTITAKPNTGYEVAKVEVARKAGEGEIKVNGDGNIRTFNMPASDVDVTVTFQKKTYTITLGTITNGTVEVTVDGKKVEPTGGKIEAEYGAALSVTAKPADNYEFASLTVGNNTYKGEGKDTYTGNVVSNLTISATFTQVYKVTLPEDGSVKFTDDKTGKLTEKKFAKDAEVSLTVTPPEPEKEEGSVISTVTATGATVASKGNNEYTFTMPAAAVTVGVSFKEATIDVAESTTIDKNISSITGLNEDQQKALTDALDASEVSGVDLEEVEEIVDSDTTAKKDLTDTLAAAAADATVEMKVFPQISPVAFKPAENTMTVDVSMMYKIVTTPKDGASNEGSVTAKPLTVDPTFEITVKIGVPASIGEKDNTVYVTHTHRGATTITSAVVQEGGFINVTLDGLSDVTISKTTDTVASITDKGKTSYYDTLAEAIEAVPNDGTIKLLKDVTLNDNIEVNEAIVFTISTAKDGDGNYTIIKNGFDIKAGNAVTMGESSGKYTFTAKKQNDITISNAEGLESASATPNPAYEGDEVSVSLTLASGYTVKSVKAGGKDTTEKNGKYTFEMPGSAVTVTVELNPPADVPPPDDDNNGGGGGGGGGGTPAASPVTVAKTENGKAEVSPANAAAGTTVTVNATPDDGYVVDQVKVVDKDGKTVPVTKDKDGKYTFKMPEGGATVTATFKKNPNPVNGFTDVKPGDWFVDAVKYAYDNNLMVGTSDTTFSPAKPVTRAEAAMILYKMNGSPSVAGLSNKFPDVQLGQWYTDAVLWCAANGKMVGYDDGSFGVSDVVTREQIALIFMRQLGGGGRDDLSGFNDAGQVSSWALEGMQWAVANDIINGNGVGLDPRGDTLRCSMAQVLMKANATAG